MPKTAYILSSLLLAGLFMLPAPSSGQAEGRLFLRWHAETYTPPFYEGRALASPGATLMISATVVSGSRIANLSNAQILWYSNDTLVEEGVGLEMVRLRAPEVPGALFEVRAEVPSLGLIETIQIPVSRPEAVIEIPLANDSLKTAEIELRAWPFFFVGNPDLLTYTWAVNGQAPNKIDDPRVLQVKIGADVEPNARLEMGVGIKSRFNQERAGESRNLFYRP